MENDKEAKVVEIPTQTTLAIELDGKNFNEIELLVLIYNDLQKIKKTL